MAFAGRLAIIAGGLGMCHYDCVFADAGSAHFLDRALLNENEGSAGGLGSSAGRLLRAQGASLFLLHHPKETPTLDERLHAAYKNPDAGDITTHECDITVPSAVQETFEQVHRARGDWGKEGLFPSILINSAGFVNIAPIDETTSEDVIRHLHINVLGPMLVSQGFAKLYKSLAEMAKERGKNAIPGGRIVSISSQASHVALDKHSAYCASKAALNGLTRSMALEWGPFGITSNTVSPTIAWTEMGKAAWPDPEVRKAFTAQVPVGRFVLPDEVAAAVGFLCQDSSAMINGADIRVDGGFSIH